MPRRQWACLSLPRVLSVVAGLALLAAFPMPWFSTQGLLLSGQFLDNFLAHPADLGQFLPGVSVDEARALKVLVDAFPVCGAGIALSALVGGLARPVARGADAFLALAALVPFVGWAVGVGRLPPGSAPEIGLWSMPLSSVAAMCGLVLERLVSRE
ncbi:MAG: hypothetical protein NVSMB2_10740 [Chloroflexota bacterium]